MNPKQKPQKKVTCTYPDCQYTWTPKPKTLNKKFLTCPSCNRKTLNPHHQPPNRTRVKLTLAAHDPTQAVTPQPQPNNQKEKRRN